MKTQFTPAYLDSVQTFTLRPVNRPDGSVELQTKTGVPIAVMCTAQLRTPYYANLLAAAPELLDALQALESALQAGEPIVIANKRHEVRAAIAQATGGEV